MLPGGGSASWRASSSRWKPWHLALGVIALVIVVRILSAGSCPDDDCRAFREEAATKITELKDKLDASHQKVTQLSQGETKEALRTETERCTKLESDLEDANAQLSSVKGKLEALAKETGDSKRTQTPVSSVGVIVFAHARRQYLERTLDTLLRHRPANIPIVVSQDGGDEGVFTLVKDKYHGSVDYMRHTDNKHAENSYIKIARHYGWGLGQMFDERKFEHVIILEEDMEIAPDFFDYFLAAKPLLDEDDTIWAISAWNDNGMDGYAKDPEKLYRADFFPGLGWMMNKDLWDELRSKWPPGYWDDWMREPDQRKGRITIRPEMSRTYTFGEKGASGGQFYNTHLSKIVLNKKIVDFQSQDLSFLTKSAYDPKFKDAVNMAERVNSINEANGIGVFKIMYKRYEDFARLAKQCGVMEDEKAGVPRTAYHGVVEFWRGDAKVYLVPESFDL